MRDGRIYYRIAYGQLSLVNQLKKTACYAWHTDEKYWSVPDTPDNRLAIRRLHQAATAKAPDDPPVTNHTSGPIAIHAAAQEEEAITVYLHPHKSDRLCIQVPKPLIEPHLSVVKNIHGRWWNKELLSWEVPYTQLTLRFLHKCLNGKLAWHFTPTTDIPEKLEEAASHNQYDKKKASSLPDTNGQ